MILVEEINVAATATFILYREPTGSNSAFLLMKCFRHFCCKHTDKLICYWWPEKSCVFPVALYHPNSGLDDKQIEYLLLVYFLNDKKMDT